MKILVCYDVSTESSAGEKRLRRMARVCINYGQRVQKSVFECALTDAQFEHFRQELLAILHPKEDNLRLYRLSENTDVMLEVHGIRRDVDFKGPLVV